MRKGEIACNKQFLLFLHNIFYAIWHLFSVFKSTLKCCLHFVSIRTSLNFVSGNWLTLDSSRRWNVLAERTSNRHTMHLNLNRFKKPRIKKKKVDEIIVDRGETLIKRIYLLSLQYILALQRQILQFKFQIHLFSVLTSGRRKAPVFFAAEALTLLPSADDSRRQKQ